MSTTRTIRRVPLAHLTIAALLATTALALLGLAGTAQAASVRGVVKSGEVKIKRAPVTMLAATSASKPEMVGKGRTNRRGRFSFRYRKPGGTDTVFYAVSGVPRTNRRHDVRLATTLGSGSLPDKITLNERTTVATAYSEAQFISGWKISGPAPGPQNAAMMGTNLATAKGGRLPASLRRKPNGTQTETKPTVNSLANMLAGCARKERRCKKLFKVTKVPGDGRPRNVLDAVAGVARNSANNVGKLFHLSRTRPRPYSPALSRPEKPDHWGLMLRFDGDGKSLDGPGNIAFDADGNAWVANNYTYARGVKSVCGSNQVMKFQPDGSYAPGSPYSGGGLSGVGYGITFDPHNKLWLSNFGFASPECADQPPHNSVSRFNLAGEPKPDEAITDGKLSWPQGIVSNEEGDIWIANCGPYNSPLSTVLPHDSFTIYPGGDPSQAQSFRDPNLDKPFDIAFNKTGKAFISSTKSDLVGMYNADGSPTGKSPLTGGGIHKPMGVASDSRGNIWVSNSALLDLPCPGNSIDVKDAGGSVALIDKHGNVLSPDPSEKNPIGGFVGGGAAIPWGMAIDGNDNVWISNFGRHRVSQFCGTRAKNCGKGLGTGDPISPDTGWSFSGLTRNTAVEIDPSGNVWVTNNWKTASVQYNPGAYEVVVMVGAAGPVKTPLIGQPKALK